MASTPKSVHWFKSSYSDNSGGECVEGARISPHTMAVRDSKDTSRGNLTIPAASWTTLTTTVKHA
ncbi:DUF397 domain-containing protein [Yinghuangia sp. ASG 101]|uniref:DUF397 domain-containing protein n=1 Tax=Yinghuangia sp. ASG 101 TaxID=2896848 RepID=UPI001E2A3514|nr:DUF397 domain-containing protein [Yinghuangia sp. ASG 101]UGQ09420.1 DUF397 domain-containing protein [Yinghuangia sp. ASG 101]